MTLQSDAVVVNTVQRHQTSTSLEVSPQIVALVHLFDSFPNPVGDENTPLAGADGAMVPQLPVPRLCLPRGLLNSHGVLHSPAIASIYRLYHVSGIGREVVDVGVARKGGILERRTGL